jgi:hypothetical protein
MGTLATQEEDPPAVVVHGAAQARVALRLGGGRGVWLLSALGAAGSMGPAWFLALVREAAAGLAEPSPHAAVLDCAEAPGHALAALRTGVRLLVLDPRCPAFPAIAGAAAALGGRVLPARPVALDLAGLDLRRPGGTARLADWLRGDRA